MIRLIPLAAALTCLAPTQDVRLAGAANPTGEIATVFTATTNMEGGELSVVMNGSEVPSAFLPQLDMTITDESTLVIVDEHREPGVWIRTYEQLSWENGGEMSMTSDAGDESMPWGSVITTPLEGAEVRFERGDDGVRAVEFLEAGDPDHLEGLRGEIGLAELLPGDSVETGDAWTVDGEALALLLEPLGDLSWDVPEEIAMHLDPDIESLEYAGELELTLDAASDGRATISVEGELIRTTVQPGDLSQVPVTDGTATDTVTETWTVDGIIVWDTENDRLNLLDLSGGFHSETHTVRDPDQEGADYESMFKIGGTLSVRAATGADVDEARAKLEDR